MTTTPPNLNTYCARYQWACLADVKNILTGAKYDITDEINISVQIKPLPCRVFFIDMMLVHYSLVFPALDGEL